MVNFCFRGNCDTAGSLWGQTDLVGRKGARLRVWRSLMRQRPIVGYDEIPCATRRATTRCMLLHAARLISEQLGKTLLTL